MSDRDTAVPGDPAEHPPGNADFVVIGSGGSALAGALTAALQGASVVVLEKGDQVGGTTSISGGGMWVPLNEHMAEVGPADSRDEVLGYLRAIAAPTADDSLITAYIDNAAAMAALFERRGGLSFRPYPTSGPTIDYRSTVPGARQGGRSLDSGYVSIEPLRAWGLEKVRLGLASFYGFDKFDYYTRKMHAWHPDQSAAAIAESAAAARAERGQQDVAVVANGAALIAQLLRACLAHGVYVAVGARARALHTDPAGRVSGVEYDRGGVAAVVNAARGVLIATGGFTHDPALMAAHHPGRTIVYTCDVESNTGDGLRLGLAAGAAVANMDDAWWMPAYTFGAESTPANPGAMTREERCLPHTLMVNALGKRFTNEAANYYDVGAALQPGGTVSNVPAWLIWDAQADSRYAMFKGAPRPADGGPPSWLRQAGTLGELARQCGIDRPALERAVDRFNAGARDGKDPDFGRGEARWDIEWGDPLHEPNPSVGPVEQAPFFAVQIGTGIFSTKGGLQVDERARVLRAADGQPIPGLYAAGNASSCCAPGAYPGLGGTLGPGMTFGYLAALDAVAPS